MTDFDKTRIGFAIALLAILFTIYPIIHNLDLSFSLVGQNYRLIWFYYATLALLCITVYIYGIRFVGTDPSQQIQRVGNLFYILTFIVPPVAVTLWVISLIENLIRQLTSESPHTKYITAGLLILLVLGAYAWTVFRYTRLLNKKEEEVRVDFLSKEQETLVVRASEMFKAQHYDLTVSESFKAIESAFRKAIIQKQIPIRGKGFQSIMDASIKANLISKESVSLLNEIRDLRNKAVHQVAPISKRSAERVLKATHTILSEIEEKIIPNN